MGKLSNFKQLKVWQKGIEIVKEVYSVTQKFSKEELYGLTSQMRRAAVSLPSNIAEGFKRYHPREFKQYLYIVLGSAAELETQLILSNELGFLDRIYLEKILEMLDHLGRMTSKMLKGLA